VYTALLPLGVQVADAGAGQAGAGAVRLHLAASAAPTPDVLAALCADFELERPAAAFDDPGRGIMRRVALAGGAPQAFLLAGDIRAQTALEAWADGQAAAPDLLRLLSGRSAPVTRARTICTCAGVTDQA